MEWQDQIDDLRQQIAYLANQVTNHGGDLQRIQRDMTGLSTVVHDNHNTT